MSTTPITDAARVKASTGFGVDDYSEDYVPAEVSAAIERKLTALRNAADGALQALAFYADPDSYFAIMILPDHPAGEFADDFSEDHGNENYNRPMAGKRARAALAAYAALISEGEG